MVSKRLYGQLSKELLAIVGFSKTCDETSVILIQKMYFDPKKLKKIGFHLCCQSLKIMIFKKKRSIYYCNFLSVKNKNLEKHRDFNSVFRLEIIFSKKRQYTCRIYNKIKKNGYYIGVLRPKITKNAIFRQKKTYHRKFKA